MNEIAANHLNGIEADLDQSRKRRRGVDGTGFKVYTFDLLFVFSSRSDTPVFVKRPPLKPVTDDEPLAPVRFVHYFE